MLCTWFLGNISALALSEVQVTREPAICSSMLALHGIRTELCKNIPSRVRETASKCSASHPQKCTMARHFSQIFWEPDTYVLIQLCLYFSESTTGQYEVLKIGQVISVSVLLRVLFNTCSSPLIIFGFHADGQTTGSEAVDRCTRGLLYKMLRYET